MSSSQCNFTSYSITSMNGSSTWRNSISISGLPETTKSNKSNKTNWSSEPLYNLYATGDSDLDGHKYVALPVGTDTNDPRIRREYNLI